tara:strand:+ start:1376 stop:1969 length:594 start_codon:yes stop_codon:yes gene_type:complete
MKKVLSVLSLVALTACSANHENYYLNDYVISENLQEKSTTEIALKNVVYARLLTNDEAVEQFGPDGDRYSVVFLKAENIGEDSSYFSFNNALIDSDESGRIKPLVDLGKLNKYDDIDLNEEDDYMNPFRETEMINNNFAYALNDKTLKDFSLQPNESKKGFLLFEKLRDPSSMQFTLSSGVSIYTTRVQTIKLDIED